MIDGLIEFFSTTGFTLITWKMALMWVIAGVLLWLAVAKGFEPLLLVPIAFGALIANLPTRGVITAELKPNGVYESATFTIEGRVVAHAPGAPAADPAADPAVQKLHVERVEGGLFDFISQGIKLELFPPLIFLGVGALTDFGPLIAMPRTLLLGAAAQLGLFVTFMGATLMGFTAKQAASIGIIGGADGPTAIFLTNKLAPELLGAVAVAAYSYMSLVPLIQPPIMRLLTTDKERRIRMKSLRKVSKLEKLIFAVMVMVVCILLVPDASALIAMLMLGNFLRECAVTERLVKSAQNEIINVLTIFLGTSVGITMAAESFLAPATLKIIVLGVIAFGFSTAGGVLAAKLMNVLSPRNPVNPLIGSAGVSAVPMAARVSHVEGQKYDQNNYLLMHAMGPNVAGVIGTAVAAGYFLATLGR
ncbi:MAG: glutaconyl-CoA decarboxylase subunit beta [Opitutus sp.]|nr:glutaconyl-CoA decarboxylase subunit beta [Opitutus sp.]